MAKGEAGRKPPPAKTFSLSAKDYAWIDAKMRAAAQRPGDAASDPPHRRKRETTARKTYISARLNIRRRPSTRRSPERKADTTWQTFVNADSNT